jgi:hypothetical protein
MHGATVTKLPTKERLEMITLTPEIATALIERNTLNRPINDSHVGRIANQILAGKWKFNGETIKVGETGDIFDGQHRCWAVVNSKTAIETIIVYGVKREAFATIDTLRKPRSGADVLSLMGLHRHRSCVAEALKWLLRWQRKDPETKKQILLDYKTPKNRIENSDIEEAYSHHARIVHAAERAAKIRRIANPSIMSFLYYVIYSQNAEIAERMMVTLDNPARAPQNDPFFKLREYFTADHLKRKDPLVSIALTIKAANAAKAGKRIERLAWRNQGEKAEAFPVLEV